MSVCVCVRAAAQERDDIYLLFLTAPWLSFTTNLSQLVRGTARREGGRGEERERKREGGRERKREREKKGREEERMLRALSHVIFLFVFFYSLIAIKC